MKIGYCRVSTAEQNLDLQKDSLKQAGCERMFEDIASGSNDERRGLHEAIEFARPGDTLIVWKLDRLGRSLKHLIEIVNSLNDRGISFRSIHESLDSSTAGGRLIFHVFGALAEFELSTIRDRTRSGILAARTRGRVGGRPKCIDAKKAALLKTLTSNPDHDIAEICRILNISRSSFYRHVKN